jgi:3-oxoisoapionate decarboxylase
MMQLGLETFSYHLAFGLGTMDVFGFIERAGELGLDGVQINRVGRHGGHLGGDGPDHLAKVRAMAEDMGLFVEVDTRGVDPEHLARALHITHALGGDVLRTYVSVGGDIEQELADAPAQLRRVLGTCAELGVRIAVENHEYETAGQVLGIVHAVDSPYVGALVDTGNSMMVWEDPVDAVRAMAPHAVSSHFKDHVVIIDEGQPMVVGVPLGTGDSDCAECFRILAADSPLERVNIEVCYGYQAPFRRPPEQGAGAKLGQGAFRVHPPPWDPACIAPRFDRPSDAQLQQLLRWQDEAVAASVAYVKELNGTASQRSVKH